ncbi:MAG: hypothetical protein E7363_01915 [Clostridiales bacterium]|nr:hypothetical protein [Clostridiales bacterium]
MMREFTRLMLSAYPKLPRVIEGVNRVINESALRSFYEQSGAFGLAERLVRKIQLRNALAGLLQDMEGATKSLTKEERAIIKGRYFCIAPIPVKGEYPFSKTTYYRRLKKAVHKVETFLRECESEQKYYAAGLHKTTFFRYLSGHIKDARRKITEREGEKRLT